MRKPEKGEMISNVCPSCGKGLGRRRGSLKVSDGGRKIKIKDEGTPCKCGKKWKRKRKPDGSTEFTEV
jgi:hypothetical protein